MSARLTGASAATGRSGGDLQRLVTDLATKVYGWSWVHFRPAKTEQGWRVPVEKPLGRWPLFLAHPKRRQDLANELKRELSDDLTPDQTWVLELLGQAGCRGHIWRPNPDNPRAGCARVLR